MLNYIHQLVKPQRICTFASVAWTAQCTRVISIHWRAGKSFTFQNQPKWKSLAFWRAQKAWLHSHNG
ncbi:hypothetical protein RUK13gorf98R [Frog virus 3]|uniref:Surface protein n=1 Tax=Frog virus 3 TaxID=10493 RepID=A0A0F6P0V7_FRG3V|nr:hypothetical protein RUK13gorf98R [Frog virus 3]